MLAAVEGDGVGATKAQHGGGLWEAGVGGAAIRPEGRRTRDPDFCPPAQLKGQRQWKGPGGHIVSTPFSPGVS